METILQKLAKARRIIKKSNLRKLGKNDYSKFAYYTPEQVESLVDNACEETKSICLCNLTADEFGLKQTLTFINLEDENQKLNFELRTKHGEITATNEAQQMGGTDTYSERYIKMKVFQIKDNGLDPDSQDHRIATINEKAQNQALAKLDKCMTLPSLTKTWNSLDKSLKADTKIISKAKEIKTLIDENTK